MTTFLQDSPEAKAARRRSNMKVGVSVLVTPVAFALGLIAYMIVGVLIISPFVAGLNSQGQVMDVSTAMTGWLVISVVGTIAGAWALVFRLMR